MLKWAEIVEMVVEKNRVEPLARLVGDGLFWGGYLLI